ncbi:MAG TPA: hypothetical protein VH477_12680 [Bryobacteraceae bacterium]
MENGAGRKTGYISLPIAALAAVTVALGAAAVSASRPALIIQKSITANDRDWRAQDDFRYDERVIRSNVDSEGHAKVQGSKTFAVLMIEGSPYRRLMALNNEPLKGAQETAEQGKLARETARRRNESAAERKKRIAKYQEQREEEHLLMQQMATAFEFRLLGEDEIAGVPCYRMAATPRADYVPPVEKARVLKGMRGTMWIDKAQFHWVKVQAEVIQPVTFGFFIAKVNPGTRFELEQAPVGLYWLPKHFVQTVNASVFGLYGYRTRDESFYSAYKRE